MRSDADREMRRGRGLLRKVSIVVIVMSKTLKIAAAALAGVMVTTPVLADDGSGFMLRVRGIGVVPDEGGSTTIGGEPDVSNDYVPELDISYFFTENIAAELILATTKHDAKAKGTSLGDVDLGDVSLLPPTLTLQYHFTNFDKFKPYVGAGVNYTMFYNEDGANGLKVDYDNSFGVAAQVGFDYFLDENWALNMDVKKLWLNTDVSINNGAIKGDVDIDPWIFGLGVGYKF